MSRRIGISSAATLAAAFLLAGCMTRGETAATVAGVRTSISLAQSSAVGAAVTAQLVSEMTGGRVPASYVDSLMVTVTRVDVLPDSVLAACRPPEGDTAQGFHPGPADDIGGSLGLSGPNGNTACERWREGHRMFGPPPGAGWPPDSVTPFDRPDDPRTHEDSLLPPDSGWGSRLDQWYSLSVVGDGRIDLMHLPTDSAQGLLLASDTVPAGVYGAARLIISDATLWLNTAVTTRDSVTLEANTPYEVVLPHRGDQPMGIMTNAGFTVPDGGGNVVLIFDEAQVFGTPIVTDSGKVVLGPMLRPRGLGWGFRFGP